MSQKQREYNKLLAMEMKSESESYINGSSSRSKRKIESSVVAFLLIIIIFAIIGVTLMLLDEDKSSEQTFDTEWFFDVILSQNIDITGKQHGILYKLLNYTQPSQGLYRKDFDHNWRYIGYSPDTIQAYNSLVTQTRFTYIYAQTFELTKDEIWLNAMYYGLNVILTKYYDNKYGGYYEFVQKYVNGTYVIINDNKSSYSQSFVIKTLCKCYDVTLNQTLLDRATDIYWLLMNNFTDFTGFGLYGEMNRNLTEIVSNGKSDNNMLHFFHCLGKLHRSYQIASNYQMMLEISSRINGIYQFIMSLRRWSNFTSTNSNTDKEIVEYFIIPANYDNNWNANKPLSENVNIGHGFEFALFIWQYIDMSIIVMSSDNIYAANNILNYCIDLGWNKTAGIIMNLPYSIDKTRWWIGLEALRTLSYFVYENKNYIDNKNKLFNLMINALDGYKNMFYDKEFGGLFYDPSKNDYVKHKTTKAGYHTTESCYDILKYSKSYFGLLFNETTL